MADYKNNNDIENSSKDFINSSGVKNVLRFGGVKAKNALGKMMSKTGKIAFKKAILLVAKFIYPSLIILGLLFAFFFFIYLIEFEFSGTEQQYSPHSENELVFNEEKNQYEAQGLNYDNSAVRDLYKYYAGRSYYQIVGKDNTKLIHPDDEDAVTDYYGNEKVFALNENFLHSLDKFTFRGSFYYPEQFTKPLHYDPDTLTLKPLVEDGNLTVVSKVPDSLAEKIDGDIMNSVRDYGLGAIMKYNNTEDWTRTVTMEGKYIKQDVWDEASKKVVVKTITPVPFSFELEKKDINLLDKVITFKGEIDFHYAYNKNLLNKLNDGTSSRAEDRVTKILYDTYTYVPKILIGHDIDGFPIYEDGKYVKYNLYKYRSEDSGIYENLPVGTGNSSTDRGTDYLYNYLYNFEANVPENVISSLEMTNRIDYDSNIFEVSGMIENDYQIDFGTYSDKKSLENSMHYLDLAIKHGAEFGVDPYLIVAMIAQESGGDTDTRNGDGLMQVTFSFPINAKDVNGVTKSVSLSEADRKNPDLNIRMGTAYLKSLIDNFDGDVFKAVSAYNLGPGTITRIRSMDEEAYNTKYGWLKYREAARLRSGGPDSRSVSYDCIPDLKKTSGSVWGDSCYLEHVMRYYIGHDTELMEDKGGVSGFFTAISNAFKQLLPQKTEETVPEFDYRKEVFPNEVDDILKSTIALDKKMIFSDIDLELEMDELSFWDERFMKAVGTSGMSLQEIMNISANDDGFFPPVILQNGARITSKFGMRIHPVTNTHSMHTGVDIAAPLGTPIYASGSGKISTASFVGTYGNVIYLEHGNGMQTRYAHLSKFGVSVGQEVTAGQVIGYMGTTGRSTGSHLHFELRINGTATDPMNIVMHQGSMNKDENLGNKVIQSAKSQVNKPYESGKSGPSSFGEIGLVTYAYKSSGYEQIPSSFSELKLSGRIVDKRNAKPGNILLLKESSASSEASIPAIYIGNDKMIMASKSLGKVVESVVYWDNVTTIVSHDISVSISSSSSNGAKALEHAKTQLGKKYLWGAEGNVDYDRDGDTRDGFDCSGLTQWAFWKAGVNISRTTTTQYNKGTAIDRANIQVGDLIYFKTGKSAPVDHVAIYMGNNQMLHASGSHGKVVVTSVYWSYMVTIRRY